MVLAGRGAKWRQGSWWGCWGGLGDCSQGPQDRRGSRQGGDGAVERRGRDLWGPLRGDPWTLVTFWSRGNIHVGREALRLCPEWQ